jgi:hypothetical protein
MQKPGGAGVVSAKLTECKVPLSATSITSRVQQGCWQHALVQGVARGRCLAGAGGEGCDQKRSYRGQPAVKRRQR